MQAITGIISMCFIATYLVYLLMILNREGKGIWKEARWVKKVVKRQGVKISSITRREDGHYVVVAYHDFEDCTGWLIWSAAINYPCREAILFRHKVYDNFYDAVKEWQYRLIYGDKTNEE